MKLAIIVITFLSTFLTAQEPTKTESAIFSGGCFWCVQHDFDEVPGVISTETGYIGGKKAHPTYKEVSAGKTGHIEAVRIVYDPSKVTYEQLLNFFWKHIDPTRADGQFCDFGAQYRPAIFYLNKKQKLLARESKKKLIEQKKVQPISVNILSAKIFYPAEEYHQEYYKKNPLRYKFYRYNSGRDQKLKELWGS